MVPTLFPKRRARLEDAGLIAGEEELGDLGKFPSLSFCFEDPDEIKAVPGPFLRTGFVAAEEEIGDVDDGTMLPTDEHYAALGLREFDEAFFLALGVAEHGLLAERLDQGFDGVEWTTALDVALGIFGEDNIGFSESRMRAGIVNRIEKADEGAGTLPAAGGEFIFTVSAGERNTANGVLFVGLFAVADDHDSFGHEVFLCEAVL